MLGAISTTKLDPSSQKAGAAGADVPVAAPPEDEAHSAEFLLKDRTQQRQEFWYTAVPFVVRSFFLLGFIFVFTWIWTSLEHGNFSTKNLQWKNLKNTFVGESSNWSIRNIRYQWRQLKRGQYLVIRGNLHNDYNASLREPDLQIRYSHTKPNQSTKRLRCCRLPSSEQLQNIRSSGQVRGWQNSLRATSRKKVPHGKSKPFTVLWVPPKGIRHFEVRVFSKQKKTRKKKARSKARRRPAVRKKPKNDDDDDSDDTDSED